MLPLYQSTIYFEMPLQTVSLNQLLQQKSSHMLILLSRRVYRICCEGTGDETEWSYVRYFIILTNVFSFVINLCCFHVLDLFINAMNLYFNPKSYRYFITQGD